MPTKPTGVDGRTPLRNFRCSDDLWMRAQAATRAAGTTVSAVCVENLEAFCERVETRQAAEYVTALEARVAELEAKAKPARAIRKAPARKAVAS